jgi:hypothetical protein
MSIIQFASKRLIPPGASDPRITARMGILHVDAGNAESLYDYFRTRSGGIESHGFIKKSGVLEQYRDTAYQADANLDANDFALSFETQGFGVGEWTEEQLAMIKRVMLWCKAKHGIPLRKVTSWNDPKGGWGYHTLFGAPSHWTPVAKTCPGPDRIAQFNRILVPWMESGGSMGSPGPTPNITDALQAKTRDDRKAALRKVIAHGSDDAANAAAAWLDAIRAIEDAEVIAHDARLDLKDNQVRG